VQARGGTVGRGGWSGKEEEDKSRGEEIEREVIGNRVGSTALTASLRDTATHQRTKTLHYNKEKKIQKLQQNC
jgi:hypothetical protein